MKIESLLRRKGGTKAEIGGVEYHFKPDANGREFADVTNPDHIGIFASIREGYRIVGEKEKSVRIDEVKQPITAVDVVLPKNLEGLDRSELSGLHYKKFGSYPPPRLSPEKIIEALRAA